MPIEYFFVYKIKMGVYKQKWALVRSGLSKHQLTLILALCLIFYLTNKKNDL